MSTELSKAVSIIANNTVSGSDTYFLDNALASAEPNQIHPNDVACVLRYIDLQLAHNLVDPVIRHKLIRLYDDLLLRSSEA